MHIHIYVCLYTCIYENIYMCHLYIYICIYICIHLCTICVCTQIDVEFGVWGVLPVLPVYQSCRCLHHDDDEKLLTLGLPKGAASRGSAMTPESWWPQKVPVEAIHGKGRVVLQAIARTPANPNEAYDGPLFRLAGSNINHFSPKRCYYASCGRAGTTSANRTLSRW